VSSFLELVLTRCRDRHNFSTFSIAAKVRLCLASLALAIVAAVVWRGAAVASGSPSQFAISALGGSIACHGNDMAMAVYGSVIAGPVRQRGAECSKTVPPS